MCTTPYSYHTFIFPFLFQGGAKKVSREQFASCLHKGVYEDKFIPTENPSKEEHDRYRYFNQAARNAIYMDERNDSAVVWNYRFDLEAIALGKEPQSGEWHKKQNSDGNPAILELDKDIYDGPEIKEHFHAELALNGVRVKLFDTGVGMLIFELENYKYPDEQAVIRINEFGRRVFVPYINSDDDRGCPLCADSITLKYGEKIIDNASGRISGAKEGKTNEIALAPIVKFFLSSAEKSVTASPAPQKNEFYIEPIIDDRMFVACIYNNDDFVTHMKEWDIEEKNYRFISDALKLSPADKENASRRFYEMVFVDGDGLSCRNRTMLGDMVEKHSYKRWIEYGTVTGITDYSMICITSAINLLALPFLAQYIEMILLTIAQRASLLAFERAISEISCKKTKLKVKDVHEKYIVFQSELLLQEVTAQQQGIELYDKMLENLFVNELQESLDTQIESLYGLNTSNYEKRENTILFFLAIFGIFEVVSTVLEGWLKIGKWWCLGAGFAFVIAATLIYYIKSIPIKHKN